MRILRPTFLIGLIAAVAGAFPLSPALADTPKVTAVLNNATAAIGEPVQLQIRVTGAGSASVPDNIAIDGLEIHPSGTSRQVEMQNFNISQSIIYNYTILPMRSGKFHIPPQLVKIGGNPFRTPELELTVSGSSMPNQSNQTRGNSSAQTLNAKLAFADITVTKPVAYVGEIIPVEVRIGFNAHVPRQLDSEPEIASQGFTIQKFQTDGRPRVEQINGVNYDVYIFKTAVAATRPGKFELGPAQAPADVVVPRQRGSRSQMQSPFDRFNLDDLLNDPLFADAAFGEQRKIMIKSAPATVEVKPLPPNAPASFSGAIGNFSLNVDANPKKIQVGDPITVTATISGRGNFDRVTAPVLPDERGWHTYPPSSKFKQDDDVGISGTKAFETVISPNERKDAVPPFEFTYFDPLGDKYVSLKSDRIPIHVEGEALTATTQGATAAAPAGTAPPPSPASPQVTARPGEILDQLDERKEAPQTFAPLFARREFWLAQIAPLLVLLGLIAWKVQRAGRRNEKALRLAGWQREMGDLRRKLRRDEGSADFFADASRFLQIRTALMTGNDPETVSAADAGRVLNTDDQMRDRIREIFDRRDELLYSGAANGSGSLAAAERDNILHLLEELSR